MACEAQDRNTRALYELELQWGAGKLDYGQLRRILTGECGRCPETVEEPTNNQTCLTGSVP